MTNVTNTETTPTTTGDNPKVSRKRYSEEFKAEAIKRVMEGEDPVVVAREIRMSPVTLKILVRDFKLSCGITPEKVVVHKKPPIKMKELQHQLENASNSIAWGSNKITAKTLIKLLHIAARFLDDIETTLTVSEKQVQKPKEEEPTPPNALVH